LAKVADCEASNYVDFLHFGHTYLPEDFVLRHPHFIVFYQGRQIEYNSQVQEIKVKL